MKCVSYIHAVKEALLAMQRCMEDRALRFPYHRSGSSSSTLPAPSQGDLSSTCKVESFGHFPAASKYRYSTPEGLSALTADTTLPFDLVTFDSVDANDHFPWTVRKRNMSSKPADPLW